MPPPQVGVVTMQPRSVALSTELPGRVEALRVAQVRARVNGVVLKRLFVEGSDVKAGQPLFQIDPAPYQAALDSAQRLLAKAQANRAMATELATRYKPLAEAKAISAAGLRQRRSGAPAGRGRRGRRPGRGADREDSTSRYAHVTAPIAGRIGRAAVTEGALVSAAEAHAAGHDPAGGHGVRELHAAQRRGAAPAPRAGGQAAAQGGQRRGAEVRIVLDDGSEMPRPGKLLFTDLSVDPTSGQVTLRAEVPNAEGCCCPASTCACASRRPSCRRRCWCRSRR